MRGIVSTLQSALISIVDKGANRLKRNGYDTQRLAMNSRPAATGYDGLRSQRSWARLPTRPNFGVDDISGTDGKFSPPHRLSAR